MIVNFPMRRILSAIATAALLFASAFGNLSHAAASKAEKAVNPLELPMMFSIVRSGAGYCEPNCPEWIYGEGQIVAGTPAAFRKILKKAGDRKLPLLIVSPGGNVMAALEMVTLENAVSVA